MAKWPGHAYTYVTLPGVTRTGSGYTPGCYDLWCQIFSFTHTTIENWNARVQDPFVSKRTCWSCCSYAVNRWLVFPCSYRQPAWWDSTYVTCLCRYYFRIKFPDVWSTYHPRVFVLVQPKTIAESCIFVFRCLVRLFLDLILSAVIGINSPLLSIFAVNVGWVFSRATVVFLFKIQCYCKVLYVDV